jgi:hypothetical protein
LPARFGLPGGNRPCSGRRSKRSRVAAAPWRSRGCRGRFTARSELVTLHTKTKGRAAAAAFAKKEYKHAAEEIRKGEAFIELEAIRAGKDGRNALNAAAADLKKPATSVEKGSVKDGKALEAVFAKAEHALALSHRVSASESWLKKEFERAGAELEAAAQHVENAAAWVGAEVKAGALAAAADARALGDKLRSGAAWTRDEVTKGFESLGNAIDAVGKKDGGNKV